MRPIPIRKATAERARRQVVICIRISNYGCLLASAIPVAPRPGYKEALLQLASAAGREIFFARLDYFPFGKWFISNGLAFHLRVCKLALPLLVSLPEASHEV